VINKVAIEYPRLTTAVASPPFTLTHGDWTSANLVWKESENKVYVIDWAGICKGSHVWDMIKFLDFERNDEILGIFLHSYSKSFNQDRTLVEFNDLCNQFHLAQAWYICGTIEFIAGIKEEHLHDPGTEWIWDFVNNQQIFSHLSM
jgi:thiamine kinase-like enzyme